MRLRYTLPALADLASILDYVADRSPQGAARVHTRIRAVTDLLLRYPQAGAVTDDPTIRRTTTTPYPYLIFYEATDAEIIIHAVRHGARDPSDNARSRSSSYGGIAMAYSANSSAFRRNTLALLRRTDVMASRGRQCGRINQAPARWPKRLRLS
jgi:toxin ParE1/3/4